MSCRYALSQKGDINFSSIASVDTEVLHHPRASPKDICAKRSLDGGHGIA